MGPPCFPNFNYKTKQCDIVVKVDTQINKAKLKVNKQILRHMGSFVVNESKKLRKKILFYKQYWKNLKSTCKRRKLGHYFTPSTKVYSKWIKFLFSQSKDIL